DVYTRSYVAGKKTVRIHSGNACIEHPAVHTIAPPQPTLHLEWFANVKSPRVDVQAILQVFRMPGLRPAVAQFSFKWPPGELEPGFIEVVAQLVGTGHPNQHWGCVGDQ